MSMKPINAQDLYDLLVVSGAPPNADEIRAKSHGRVIEKTADVIKSAMGDRENLRFSKVLHKISNVQTNIMDLESTQRQAIAKTLSTLADKRIVQKENFEGFFGGISKFFHKLNQKIHGHGFQTKGEYGIQLATELALGNTPEMLHTYIQNPEKIDLPNLTKEVASLNKEQFTKLLDKSVFGQTTPEIDKGGSPKYNFYSALSPEKQAIFGDHLMKKADWFNEIVDIFKLVSNTTATDISKFVEKLDPMPFEEIAGTLGSKWRNANSGWRTRHLCEAGIRHVTKGWIANGDYESMKNWAGEDSALKALINHIIYEEERDDEFLY